jgi:hypothetical protein
MRLVVSDTQRLGRFVPFISFASLWRLEMERLERNSFYISIAAQFRFLVILELARLSAASSMYAF